MTGPVLSTKRAADYCGLARQTFYNLRHAGTGPTAYKQGRLTVYYPSDLDEWLESRLKRVPEPSSACT